MNRGIGSHVSKDDLTPGKEGRTCENLLCWLPGSGARGWGGRDNLMAHWGPLKLFEYARMRKQTTIIKISKDIFK